MITAIDAKEISDKNRQPEQTIDDAVTETLNVVYAKIVSATDSGDYGMAITWRHIIEPAMQSRASDIYKKVVKILEKQGYTMGSYYVDVNLQVTVNWRDV